MTVTRVWLLILLAFTALAGVLGAYVAFTMDIATYGEIEGGVSIAMVFLAILFGFASYLARPGLRLGGSVLYAGGLGLWISLLLVYHKAFGGEKWLEMMATVLVAGLPAGFGLLFYRKPWGKVFAWGLAFVSLCSACMMLPHACLVGFAFAFFGGPVPGRGELPEKFFYAGMVCEAILGPACLLLVNLGRGDRRYFRWPGVLIALGGYGFACNLVFKPETQWRDLDMCALNLSSVVVGVLVLINLLLMGREADAVRVCKWLSIWMVLMFGALDGYLIVGNYLHFEISPSVHEGISRVGLAFAFAAVGTMLCQVLVRTLVRATAQVVSAPLSQTGISQVMLTCPNCQVAGAVALPEGKCANCLLQFQIGLTEPICGKCGYRLINLTGDRCPECGDRVGRPGDVRAHTVPAQTGGAGPVPT